jgi:hypothetical protein
MTELRASIYFLGIVVEKLMAKILNAEMLLLVLNFPTPSSFLRPLDTIQQSKEQPRHLF